MEKPEDTPKTPNVQQENITQSPQTPSVTSLSDESPSGWLSFFLYFALPIGSLVSLITNIASYSSAAEDYSFVDVGLSAALLALAILTIIHFVKHREDSVILAKTYLVVCFSINLIALLAGETDSSMITKLVRSLISAVLWFWYLTASEQVERLIPKSTRKHTKLSKWVIAVFILIPLLFVGYVTSVSSNEQAAMLKEITEEKLRQGEYTDGRIIFRAPYGYEVESDVIEELKVFSMSNDEDASYTVCSDFTDEFSEKEFDEYWESWLDENLAEFEYDIDRDSEISVNGNPAYFKVIKFHTENPIYWYFALVYNEISCKEAVVSTYKIEDEYSSDFVDFLNSIEFYRK